jgi:hypothetical protein
MTGGRFGAFSSQHGITNSSLPLRRSFMSSYYAERDWCADSENMLPTCFLIRFSPKYAIGVGEVGHELTRRWTPPATTPNYGKRYSAISNPTRSQEIPTRSLIHMRE